MCPKYDNVRLLAVLTRSVFVLTFCNTHASVLLPVQATLKICRSSFISKVSSLISPLNQCLSTMIYFSGCFGVVPARPEKDGIWGRGREPPPHQLGAWGSAVSFPVGSGASPRPKSISVRFQPCGSHLLKDFFVKKTTVWNVSHACQIFA